MHGGPKNGQFHKAVPPAYYSDIERRSIYRNAQFFYLEQCWCYKGCWLYYFVQVKWIRILH